MAAKPVHVARAIAFAGVVLLMAVACGPRQVSYDPVDPGFEREQGVSVCRHDSPQLAQCLTAGSPLGRGDVALLECDGCGRGVRMAIQPVGNVRAVAGRRRIQQSPVPVGFVVAIIDNLDSIEFTDMALGPGERAYWWYGKTSSSGQVESRFYVVNRRGGVELRATGTGDCPGDAVPRPRDEAEWNKHQCPVGPSAPTLQFVNSSWFSCIDGCCTSGRIARAL